MKKLKEKYKLTICSNSARDLFDVCANKLPIIFDKVFISDETKVNKPHPEMYSIAIKNFGVPKEIGSHVELAARPGFEPGSKDSKSLVLPLHHRAVLSRYLV